MGIIAATAPHASKVVAANAGSVSNASSSSTPNGRRSRTRRLRASSRNARVASRTPCGMRTATGSQNTNSTGPPAPRSASTPSGTTKAPCITRLARPSYWRACDSAARCTRARRPSPRGRENRTGRSASLRRRWYSAMSLRSRGDSMPNRQRSACREFSSMTRVISTRGASKARAIAATARTRNPPTERTANVAGANSASAPAASATPHQETANATRTNAAAAVRHPLQPSLASRTKPTTQPSATAAAASAAPASATAAGAPASTDALSNPTPSRNPSAAPAAAPAKACTPADTPASARALTALAAR